MFDATLTPVRRALLSVSDKTGLIDLARGLDALGIALISTGGTARALRDAGLPVTEVSTLTGFQEIMNGRVKTLNPAVHGGLLGRRGRDDAVMAEHGIAPIDLLVVNLYPFEQAIAAPDCGFAEAIENIDIGGPAMLRAAAKNHDHVAVAVEPADYAELLEALSNGGTSLTLRRRLATKAYAHTARYDGLIANWLGTRADAEKPDAFPPSLISRSSVGRVCAMARIRIRARRSTSKRMSRAALSPLRACSPARNCPSTTSPTPMPHSNA